MVTLERLERRKKGVPRARDHLLKPGRLAKTVWSIVDRHHEGREKRLIVILLYYNEIYRRSVSHRGASRKGVET